MIAKFKNNSKTIIFHLIASLALIALSCISLFFNEWIVIINMTISCLISFINVCLFILSKENIDENGPKLSFGLYTLARYALMFIGVLVSAILINITMTDPINKYRYLTILITAFPFFMNVFALLLEK